MLDCPSLYSRPFVAGLAAIFLSACQLNGVVRFGEHPPSTDLSATKAHHQPAKPAPQDEKKSRLSNGMKPLDKKKAPSISKRKPSFALQRQLSAKTHKALPWSRDIEPLSSSKRQSRRPAERSLIYKPDLSSAAKNSYRDLPFSERTVSLRLNEVPMRVLSELLGSMIPANIGLAKDVVNTPVTMRAENMPWPALFDALAQLYDFHVYRQGKFLLVENKQESGSTSATVWSPSLWQTEMFRLSYTRPEKLKPIVEALFARQKNKPLIGIDERTRSLIVSAPPTLMQTITALLDNLDAPLRQISIEGFIVEADKDFARSLGSRVGIHRLAGGRLSGVLGRNPNTDEQGNLSNNTTLAVDLATANAAAGIGILLDRKRLKLELTAMEKEGKSRIISNPRVLTVENQEAVIFQGDEVPYFTVSDHGTQTQFKEAGIKLTVMPTIVGRKQLMLDISVNKDTVDTRVENPPITRRHIQTRMLVANRAVAVIGGIYFNSKSESDVRVPWLHRIPLLGRLFVKSQKNTGVKELLVFISPTMISS